MSVRLVYRNSTPEVMAWAEDFKRRANEIGQLRWDWMHKLYDDAGIPQNDGDDVPSWKRWRRGARVWNNGAMAGLQWPRDMDDKLPTGWFRPAKENHLVRPRGNKQYAEQQKQLSQFNDPNMRGELQKRFGMQEHTFAGSGLYTNGIRLETDAVWVMWGSLDVSQEKWIADLAQHGWEQVPLVEYIAAFGEEALR